VGFEGAHNLRVKYCNLFVIIIGLSRCVATRVAYVDGRTTVGRQARAADDERRPAAGRNRGFGRRRASQIAMSLQGRGVRGRTDGRAGTSNPAAERLDGLLF